MTEEELGTIRGPSQRIREIIAQTALAGRGDPYHSDVYVSVSDGRVDTVVGSQGNTLLTYCTFTDDALSEVNVEAEDVEQVQGIFHTPDFLSYLDFASDGGEVLLTLRGNPDNELASVLEVTGALNTRVMLPTSDSIMDDVPLTIADRFDSENNFKGQEGTLETTIETDTEQIQRLIEIVEYDPETEFFPITIEETEDGDFDFTLDIGRDSGRNAVWGELSADVVESEEAFQNNYHEGFEPVFDTLDGDVSLQTAPGGAPLAVVHERDGVTIRHVLANLS
jgi:hypothetical protein